MTDAGNSPENPSHSDSPCGDHARTPIVIRTKQILPLRVYAGETETPAGRRRWVRDEVRSAPRAVGAPSACRMPMGERG